VANRGDLDDVVQVVHAREAAISAASGRPGRRQRRVERLPRNDLRLEPLMPAVLGDYLAAARYEAG